MTPTPEAARETMTADLLARLEEAAEGSRELDFAIAEHLGMHPCWSKSTTGAKKMHRHVGGGPIPAWTSGIDAALTLVPEGFSWLVGNGEAWMWKANSVGHNPRLRVPAWDVRTPALALVIAALRARAEKE